MSAKSPLTKTEAERSSEAQSRAPASSGLGLPVQSIQADTPSTGAGILTTGPASYKGPDGYPKLASYMEQCSEEVIFRQFRRLNLLNLMSLQAELVALESEYLKACQKDSSSENPTLKSLSKSFSSLREYGSTSRSEQYELLKNIREKLKEYSMSLKPAETKCKLRP
jgi:hypothetical protein